MFGLQVLLVMLAKRQRIQPCRRYNKSQEEFSFLVKVVDTLELIHSETGYIQLKSNTILVLFGAFIITLENTSEL